jgi:hypothetical protein
VEQIVNAAKEAASPDLETEIRAPAVAPVAAPSGASVVEFLVQPQRCESVYEPSVDTAPR